MKNWIALSLWQGVQARHLQVFEEKGIDLERLFSIKKTDWCGQGFPSRLFAKRVLPDDPRVYSILEWAKGGGCTLIRFCDSAYPVLLKEIASPPLLLYAIGDVSCLHRRQVAIVGSRRASPRSLEFAYSLSADLAAAGCVVTSGLALGVDAAAHRGALSADGATIAVMANGLDRVYPHSHHSLASKISASGVLLSEQAPWVPPKACLFPQRNRLVSGLSAGIVIVEAALRSGSLITARLGLEQNREVMAVPGEAGSHAAAGCHSLLRDGAGWVESVNDVFECLGWQREITSSSQPKAKEKKRAELSKLDTQVLACVDASDTNLEQVLCRYQGGQQQAIAALSRLELAGWVRRTASGYQAT